MTKPLETYTEKAFSILGGTLPEVIYLPPSLRTRRMPKTESIQALNDDQLDRIVKADPLGFLFAIMEGKAIRSFTVRPTADEQPQAKPARGRPKKETATTRIKLGEDNCHTIYVEYHSPTMADRERVAIFLAKFIARDGNSPAEHSKEDEFSLLCAKRAAQVDRKMSDLVPSADVYPQDR